MRCPALSDLPPPRPGKTGWPWTDAPPPAPATLPDGAAWPRISIVTPSFNQGRFLEETLRSVLLQGYPDLEYVVIDGGSTDESVGILQRYEPWLAHWESAPDRGQSDALNKGLARCTGDVVTFIGSDDLYLPGAFADVARRQAAHPACGVFVGAFRYLDAHSRLVGEPRLPKLPHDGPLDLTLGPPGVYRLHQVATFYARNALDQVGRHVREDLVYTMDRELLYRVCRRFKVCLAERPYGAFRRHEDSKSVAALLPFSQEFARLYRLHRTGNRAEDRLRERMARYHTARGYLKYAAATDSALAGAAALLKALAHRPAFVFQRGYLARWLKVLGRKPHFSRQKNARWAEGP